MYERRGEETIRSSFITAQTRSHEKDETINIKGLIFMNLTEYVEKVSGIQLTVYQKRMLELLGGLPKDSCIVMGRKGPLILDSNGKRIDYEQIEEEAVKT